MVGFQSNPAFMVINADKIAVVCLEGHRHTWIFDIRLNKRAGPVVGFQISPEKTFADGYLISRETP